MMLLPVLVFSRRWFMLGCGRQPSPTAFSLGFISVLDMRMMLLRLLHSFMLIMVSSGPAVVTEARVQVVVVSGVPTAPHRDRR
jgi:hypothetical protein